MGTCYDFIVIETYTGTEGASITIPDTSHAVRFYSSLQGAIDQAEADATTRTILLCGNIAEDVTWNPGDGNRYNGSLIIHGIAAGGLLTPTSRLTGTFTHGGGQPSGYFLEFQDFEITGTFTAQQVIGERVRARHMQFADVELRQGDYFFEGCTMDDLVLRNLPNELRFEDCEVADIDGDVPGVRATDFQWRGGKISGSVTIREANNVLFDTDFRGTGVPGYHIKIGFGLNGPHHTTIRGTMSALSGVSAAKDYILLDEPSGDAFFDLMIDLICEKPTSTTNEVHYLRAVGPTVIRNALVKMVCGIDDTGTKLEDMAGGYVSIKGKFAQSVFILSPCDAEIDLTGSTQDSNCIVSGAEISGNSLAIGPVHNRLHDHSDALDGQDLAPLSINFASSTLTIASGIVTVTRSAHLITPEGGAGSDTLAGMAGGTEGDVVHLASAPGKILALPHNDTAEASAGERFFLPGSTNIIIGEATFTTYTVRYRDDLDSGSGGWEAFDTFNHTNAIHASPSTPEVVDASAAVGTSNADSKADHEHKLGIVITRGDIITRSATLPVRLALGAANRVLKSDGTDAAWAQVGHDELTDVGANDHPHGIAAHTEHANWKVLYTDGSGDEQELALGADAKVLVAAGVGAAPVFEDIYTTHIAQFPALAEDLATGVMGARPGLNVGESGEHGAFTAIRAKAIAGTAGTGTTTILIEADDNPAFSSPTVLFTLALNTSTEVDDTVLDNAWASGDIFVRARCTAVGATAPKDVNVEFYFKERAENF
jgi:hypothetical protein